MSFDIIRKGLFPVVLAGLASIFAMIGIVKYVKNSAPKPKVPVRSSRPKEPVRCSRPGAVKEGFLPNDYVDKADNLSPPRVATNFDSVDPFYKPFNKTPLDTFFDEYEDEEEAAQEAALNARSTVDVIEQKMPNFGAAFGTFDATIKEIPWDSDNKDYLPSDVLWGYVSVEASKSIFVKVYHRTLLADADNLQEGGTPDVPEPPQFQSAILPVSTSDPVAGIAAESFDGIIGALGQQINPLDSGNLKKINDALKGLDKIDDLPVKKPGPIGKFTEKVGARAKKLLGITKAKSIMKNLASKLKKVFMKALKKFMVKMTAKLAVMVGVQVATIIGLTIATIFSAAASAALAAFTAMVSLLNIAVSVIDAITAALAIALPPVLEKAFDGNGICPPGSRTIREIIPDPTAYFFFTTFVPLGDLIDIFGDYICWEGARMSIKKRVTHQGYEYDRTMSLYMHQYMPHEVPDGDRTEDVVKYRDENNREVCPSQLGNYVADNRGERATGKYYELCRNGTRAATLTDPICEGISSPAKARKPTKAACTNGWRDDGLNCWEDWKGMSGGGCTVNCDNVWSWSDGGFCHWKCTSPRDLGGCGCIKTRIEDRLQCPSDFPDLDRGTGLCYARCPPGQTRDGNMCWSTQPTYMRSIVTPYTEKKKIPGRVLPELKDVKIDWCNFASPIMLDRMAQFYYDYSFMNPDLLQDSSGNVLIQYDYIVKFYGVIASSELSCDVICDIKTVTYEPITGAFYKESIGCTYEDDPTNTRCYRRFYFIKMKEDSPGLFTVTGCTNSDFTAPDAMVSSWDEGVEYVPSLPKVFEWRQKVPGLRDIFNMDTIKKVATAAAIQGAGNVAGGKVGGGVIGSTIASTGATAAATKVSEKYEKQIGNALLTASDLVKKGILGVTGATTPAIGNVGILIAGQIDKLNEVAKSPGSGDETYITGDGTNFYLMTDDEHINVNHGPINEQAMGIIPSIQMCNRQRTTEPYCGHKYILRDTIYRYQNENPNKRVKQVDILEARGRLGCYYKWREVSYNKDTNMESNDYTSRSVMQEYKIVNNNTCLMVADKFVYDVADSDKTYPIRSYKVEQTETYPSRKKITKPVRFVRIEGGSNILAFSQLVVRNTDAINVAVGKPVKATDPANADGGMPLYAKNAVNGVEQTRQVPDIYQSRTAGAFFEVDLGKEEFIQSVSVYNIRLPSETFAFRPKTYPNNLQGLTFSTSISQCIGLEATIARTSHLNSDRNSGASWDVYGWLNDRDSRGNQLSGRPRTTGVETISVGGTVGDCDRPDGLNPTQPYVVCYGEKPPDGTYPRDQLPAFNGAQYSRFSGDLNRLAGYRLVLMDATRTVNYTFTLTGATYQMFNNFPTLALDRKFPSKSFLVPQALPYETVLKSGCGKSGQDDLTCSTIEVINDLVSQFNSANQSAKILKVMKAVTPSSKRCDYQVQMMRIGADGTKVIGTESVRIDVAEDTGRPCNFRRVGDGSASLNSGTFIQVNTPDLSGNGIGEGGVFAFKNILSGIKNRFDSIINSTKTQDPVKALNDSSKDVNKTVTNILGSVAANQTLVGCPTKKCSDPDVLAAIAASYNDMNNKSTELFGVERSTMRQILNVSGASSTECDITFQELNESYEDILYPPTESTYKIRSARFVMENKGNCVFQVATTPNAITMDISSTAFGLQSDTSKLANPYVVKQCLVDCTLPANLAAIKRQLESTGVNAKTIPVYKSVTQTYRNGNGKCEYLMKKDVSTINNITKQFETESDIDTYISATFTMNLTTCVPSLTKVEEFLSDDIESRGDDYYINGVKVDLPALYGYESTKPSRFVNATTIDLTKIST